MYFIKVIVKVRSITMKTSIASSYITWIAVLALLTGVGTVSAAIAGEPGGALMTALWQFEGNASFESGARIEAGLIQFKPCAADLKRGSRGEVSRFQILPAIWRDYSNSRDYKNPYVAREVARKILIERDKWFRSSAGRPPTNFDLYVMWNAPGHYSKVGFSRKRLHAEISEKAQRFANLVESSVGAPVFQTALR